MATHREDETLPVDPLLPPQTNPAPLATGNSPVAKPPTCEPAVATGQHQALDLLPGGAAPPARAAGGSLWQSLRRRWLLALTVGLLVGGVPATLLWFLRPANYTAFALVKVDPQSPELLPTDRVVDDLELYRMTQTALIKGPPVLEAALRDDKVRHSSLVAQQSDPVAWLESELVVEPIPNTELLRVSLSASDPDEAATLVNAVAQAYLQDSLSRDQKQRLDRLKDLKEVCEQSEDKLRGQRKRLQGVAESLKTNDHKTNSLRQQIALEEYIALRKELIAIQSQLREVSRSRVDGTREASPEGQGLSDVVIEQTLDDHPEVLVQAQKVEQAEKALAQIKANALPGYHGIAEAEEEVGAAKEAMAGLRARLRRGLEARFRQRAEAEAQLANAKLGERETLMKEQYDAVWKEAEEQRKAADQIGLASVLYESEQSEIEQADKIVQSLWAERERLEAEGRSTVQRIRVAAEATPPRTVNRKSQILAAGLAGFVGLLIGAFGVALLDYRTWRIHSRDEVVHGLRLRVLGCLPILMARPLANHARRQLKYAYWGHQWAEALNGLRTVLLHEAGQHGLQVVQVTSAAPREGKTTLASHLAISLAAAGRRTLLIDADLRRPVLHNVFAVPQAPGLCEVLREELPPAAAIQPTSILGLDLLPAGLLDHAVLQLLAQGRLEASLQVLRAQYDAIVIDSSPIMAVNDALLVGHHVDAVLLSIRPSRSRAPVVQEACERLRSLDIPVLGTVLNGLLSSHQGLLDRYLSSAAAAATPPATLSGGKGRGA